MCSMCLPTRQAPAISCLIHRHFVMSSGSTATSPAQDSKKFFRRECFRAGWACCLWFTGSRGTGVSRKQPRKPHCWKLWCFMALLRTEIPFGAPSKIGLSQFAGSCWELHAPPSQDDTRASLGTTRAYGLQMDCVFGVVQESFREAPMHMTWKEHAGHVEHRM